MATRRSFSWMKWRSSNSLSLFWSKPTSMKPFLSILLSTIWISVNEFFRNEFLLKSHWDEHYSNLGLTFPGEPINGAVWGLWSLAFALGIYVISRRFSFLETTGLAWLMGFVLMWLVTGNMLVLPFSILPFAVPLSILETAERPDYLLPKTFSDLQQCVGSMIPAELQPLPCPQ